MSVFQAMLLALLCVVIVASGCRTSQDSMNSQLAALRDNDYQLLMHSLEDDRSRLAFYICHAHSGGLEALMKKGIFSSPRRCVSAFQDADGNPVSWNRSIVQLEKALHFSELQAFVEDNEDKSEAEIKAALAAIEGEFFVNTGQAFVVQVLAFVTYTGLALVGKVPMANPGLFAQTAIISTFVGSMAYGAGAAAVKTYRQGQRYEHLRKEVEKCQNLIAALGAGSYNRPGDCQVMNMQIPSLDDKVNDLDVRDYLAVFDGDYDYVTSSRVNHVVGEMGALFNRSRFGHESGTKTIATQCFPSSEKRSRARRSVAVSSKSVCWDVGR